VQVFAGLQVSHWNFRRNIASVALMTEIGCENGLAVADVLGGSGLSEADLRDLNRMIYGREELATVTTRAVTGCLTSAAGWPPWPESWICRPQSPACDMPVASNVGCMTATSRPRALVIGAGFGGLGAAYELTRDGLADVTVVPATAPCALRTGATAETDR
jgi:hypothetical protein